MVLIRAKLILDLAGEDASATTPLLGGHHDDSDGDDDGLVNVAVVGVSDNKKYRKAGLRKPSHAGASTAWRGFFLQGFRLSLHKTRLGSMPHLLRQSF